MKNLLTDVCKNDNLFSNKMKNFLVTDCTGFIGLHFVRYFINKYPDYNIFNLNALVHIVNLENSKDLDFKPNQKSN